MSNENWVSKANGSRSFADVLKGSKPSAQRSEEPNHLLTSKSAGALVETIVSSGVTWSSSTTSPIKMSPQNERTESGGRSPLSVSPVTVGGALGTVRDGRGKSTSTSTASCSMGTNTKINRTTSAATNTDLPRTPTAKVRPNGNAWASPFLQKSDSVSSETQTPGVPGILFKTPTPATHTASTQTGERHKNSTTDTGTSTDEVANGDQRNTRHAETGFDDEEGNKMNRNGTRESSSGGDLFGSKGGRSLRAPNLVSSGTTMSVDVAPEAGSTKSIGTDPTSPRLSAQSSSDAMQPRPHTTPPRGFASPHTAMAFFNSSFAAPAFVETPFPASPTKSGSPSRRKKTSNNTTPSIGSGSKTHTFRATKSPFIPSYLRGLKIGAETLQAPRGGTKGVLRGKVYSMKEGPNLDVSASFLRRLSQEISDFEAYTNEMTDMFEEHINKCINKTKHVIFTTMKQYFKAHQESKPKAPEIAVHGSFATKLWLPSSDIDMVVMGVSSKRTGKTAGELLSEATRMLQIIAGGLEKESWVANVMMITTSNMPVIKFNSTVKKGDVQYQFPFDVSIDPGATPDLPGFTHAHTGLPAKEMINHFLSVMPEFRAIMLVLKQLLRERGLNDTYRGGLSSYGLALIVTRFLQPFYPELMKTANPEEHWVRSFSFGSRPEQNSKHNRQNEKKRSQRKHVGESPVSKKGVNVLNASPVVDQQSGAAENVQLSPLVLDEQVDSAPNDQGDGRAEATEPAAAKTWASLVANVHKKIIPANGNRRDVTEASSVYNKIDISPVQSTSPSLPSSVGEGSPSLGGEDLNVEPSLLSEKMGGLNEKFLEGHTSVTTSTTASPHEDPCGDNSSSAIASNASSDPDRSEIMGATLLDFLHYFGNTFEYEKHGISIRDGGMYFRLVNAYSGSLWVDDPISPGHNVASSTFNASAVLNSFRDAFLAMVRHETSEHYPTLLSRVIRSQPWLPHAYEYAQSCHEMLLWENRERASPQEYALAAQEIMSEMEKIILERQRMGIKQSGNNGKANGKKDGKKKSKGQPGGKTVVDNPSVPSVAKDDKRHGAKKQKKKKRANKSASAAEPTSSSGANITKQKESSKSKSDGASDRQVNNGNGETVTKAMGRRIRRKRDQQEYGPRGNRKRDQHGDSQQDSRRVPQGLTLGAFYNAHEKSNR